eukprot:TRINITY_DN1220_c3_g1_i1.p1 TRINITY_DN1220_c3_g1~~TRINITY_DN1220_c3_g1_i1.p1  ORF type:complete len:286 (-),score=145.61 TRINITY_DN1220_c3_g1_i1:37-894(-)
MGKFAQFVVGPAGAGKSSYCAAIQEYYSYERRTVHIVNLDPAAEDLRYEASIDVRKWITVKDAMEELEYGPNGGLLFCMEYLVNNFDELSEEFEGFEDDYLLIDCPGQIELYTHLNVMQNLLNKLQQIGYRICCVHLIDSTAITDAAKFLSCALVSLSSMVQFDLPHVNVLSKIDLVASNSDDYEKLERYFDVDVDLLLSDLQVVCDSRFLQLNYAFAQLLDSFNLVSFKPLNLTDQNSISILLQEIDNAIQFAEDQDVRILRDPEFNDSEFNDSENNDSENDNE